MIEKHHDVRNELLFQFCVETKRFKSLQPSDLPIIFIEKIDYDFNYIFPFLDISLFFFTVENPFRRHWRNF